jgi:hypothetical protein
MRAQNDYWNYPEKDQKLVDIGVVFIDFPGRNLCDYLSEMLTVPFGTVDVMQPYSLSKSERSISCPTDCIASLALSMRSSLTAR